MKVRKNSKLLMCLNLRCFWLKGFAGCMCCCLVYILQVFIPIYRGFERRWELAGTSTCLAWSFDSSPLIFCLIWWLSYEEPISNPFHFQRNNVCEHYCYSCLVVETSCSDGCCEGMRRVSGCTIRTLYFVNALTLLMKSLMMNCF